MSASINEAIEEVMVILMEFDSPRDAAEILVRAHARMTAKCGDDVNVDTMLPVYVACFRELYRFELELRSPL